MANISNAKYEELQLILERQNGRAYAFEEAKEIGDRLLDFYTTLLEIEKSTEGAVKSRH